MIMDNTINGIAWTFFDALITVSTLFFDFMNFKEACMFEDPGDKPCWAEKLAEWSVIK